MRRFGNTVAGVTMLASALGVLSGGAVAQTDYAGKTMDSGAGLMAGMAAGSAPLSYLARYDGCVTFSLTPTITSGITATWASGILTISYPPPSNGDIVQGQVVYLATSSGYSSGALGELVQSASKSGGEGLITLNIATNPIPGAATITSLGYCNPNSTRAGEQGAPLTFFGTPNTNGIGSPDAGYVMGNLFASSAATMNTGFTDADFGAYSVWATDHITTPSGSGSSNYYPPAPIDADGGGFMYGSANDVPLIFENSSSIRFITHVIESRVLAGKTTPCNTTTNPCIVPSAVTETSACNPAGECGVPSPLPSGCNSAGGTTMQCGTQFSGPLIPSRDSSDAAGTFFELYWGSQYPGAAQLWKCRLISSYAAGFPTGTGDYISCNLWADFQNGGLAGIGWDYNKNWSGTAFMSVSDDFTLAIGGGASYQGLGNGNGGSQTLTINSFVMPVHNNVGGTSCPNGTNPTQPWATNCSYLFQFIPTGCSIGQAYGCTNSGSTTAPSGTSCSSGFTFEDDLGTIRPGAAATCEPNWNSCPTEYYFASACTIPEANGSGYWINIGTVNDQGPGFDVVNYDSVNGYSHWNTRMAMMDRGWGVNGSGTNPLANSRTYTQLYTDDTISCYEQTGAACSPAVPFETLFTIHDTAQVPRRGYAKVAPTGGAAVNCNYMTAAGVDPNDCSPQVRGMNWPEISSGPNGECTTSINATQTYWPAVWGAGSSWEWPQAMQWQSAGLAPGGSSPYTGRNQWAVSGVNHQTYFTAVAPTSTFNGNVDPANDASGTWQIQPYYCDGEFPGWNDVVMIAGVKYPLVRPLLLMGPLFGAAGGHAIEGQMYENGGGNFFSHLFNQINCDSTNANCSYVGQPNPGAPPPTFLNYGDPLLYAALPCDEHPVYDNANAFDTTPPYIATSQVPFWGFDPACGTGSPHAACPAGVNSTVCAGAGYTGSDPICSNYVASGYGEELALNSNPRNGLTWRFTHHGGSGSIGTYAGQNQWGAISPDGLLASVTSDAMNTRGDVNAPTSACETPTRAMWANWAKNACVETGDVFLSKATGGPTYTLTSCGTTCSTGCNTGTTQPNWSSCTSTPCSVTDAAGNVWSYDGTNSCETDVFVTALPTAVPAP